MVGCQEITERIEKENIQKLSFRERFSIRLHVMMCKTCRVFRKDSKIMDKMLRRKWISEKECSYSEIEKNELKKNIQNSASR